MRGLDLCYYHDRYQPKPGYRNLPCLEDAHSVQCAIQEIIEDMLAGYLDYKKAALALYGLQTAASNLKQMRLAEQQRAREQEKAPSVDRAPCAEQSRAATTGFSPARSAGNGGVLPDESRRDGWNPETGGELEALCVDRAPWTVAEEACTVDRAPCAEQSRAATTGFSPVRSAGHGGVLPDESRRDGWNAFAGARPGKPGLQPAMRAPCRKAAESVAALAAEVRVSSDANDDDIEEIELTADLARPTTEDRRPTTPLPTTEDQRPTTFIESPRPPQHVTRGLRTQEERKAMEDRFPDLAKLRAELRPSLDDSPPNSLQRA